MNDQDTRRLIASVNVSLDGFSAGPDGDNDVMWFVEHVTDQLSSYFEGVYRGSTTALLGRKNYEGFSGSGRPSPTTRRAPPGTATWGPG